MFLLFKILFGLISHNFINLFYFLEVEVQNLLHRARKWNLDKILIFLTLFCVCDKKILFFVTFSLIKIIYE